MLAVDRDSAAYDGNLRQDGKYHSYHLGADDARHERLGTSRVTEEGTVRLSLQPAPMQGHTASALENATAGILAIEANGTVLTEGVPIGGNELQPGPLISAYPLAEWLVWNWWRLRWEPTSFSTTRAWAFAHRLSSIGSGYRWPNVQIESDGAFVRLSSTRSADPEPLFRYVGAPHSERIPAADFESAVDDFVEAVLARLKRVPGQSNVATIAEQVTRDRAEPREACFRRLQAVLGHDPDEGSEPAIRQRVAEADSLGGDASLELAAGAPTVGLAELRDAARRAGFDTNPKDRISVGAKASSDTWGSTEAWRIGVREARSLRAHVAANGKPISNLELADMVGVQPGALEDAPGEVPVSFELQESSQARIALRSKWETGRRFDLARLLGDRVFSGGDHERLRAVTRSYTYRQKAQRAFAAEFLAPIDAVDDYLGGDYAEDRQDEAARYFQVSPFMVRSLLVNNDRLGRNGALDVLDRM